MARKSPRELALEKSRALNGNSGLHVRWVPNFKQPKKTKAQRRREREARGERPPKNKMRKLKKKRGGRGDYLSREELLQKMDNQLNANLPKSERWFMAEYQEVGLFLKSDQNNKPFGNYIPDIVNHSYKYVIEIHDPGHNLADRKLRDEVKEKAWKRLGYAVFIVWAWNLLSFEKFAREMSDYRERYMTSDYISQA